MRGFVATTAKAAALFALCLVSTGAAAQERIVEPEPGTASLGLGLGFTVDPGTFLMGLEVPFAVTDGVTLGPLLQVGVSDDDTWIAPTMNLRYALDLADIAPDLARLRPMVQGGLGFAYLEKDGRRGDDDDTRFMFNLGFGAEYFLTDNLAFGSNMLFNILPEDAVDEHFVWSWQLGTMRVLF